MRFFYMLLLFLWITSCKPAPEGFSVQGKITGLDHGKAILQRRMGSEFQTVDSSSIDQGTFSFRGKIENPEMFYIHIADSLPYLRLFLENSDIQLEAHVDSLKNPVINGSKCQDLLSSYHDLMRPFEDRLQEIYAAYRQAYQAGDMALYRELEKKFDRISDEQKKKSLAFIKENSSSPVSPYLVWGTLAYDLNIEELQSIFNEFASEIRNSVYTRQIAEYIETLKKVDIGQPFTEIALPDTTGQIQKLSDLKGNLIMVDFWASWCGPCRRENPFVVSLYQEYQDKNFKIFGVSLDENKQKWEKAIVDDQLTWYHVSDLKGWESAAGKDYGVRAIPHTVLINQDGIIIAKNLRGEDLRKKITELLIH
jgi:thiol-disulfide isomerase/thioredoxin